MLQATPISGGKTEPTCLAPPEQHLQWTTFRCPVQVDSTMCSLLAPAARSLARAPVSPSISVLRYLQVRISTSQKARQLHSMARQRVPEVWDSNGHRQTFWTI